MENKHKINFLTWELVEKNLTSLVFSNFLWNTPKKILEVNKVFVNASILDVLMVESLLGVDPTQSYGGNTKAPSKIS